MHRRIKQILYALLYLIFWGGVAALVYTFFLKPPASCFDNIQNQGEQGVDCGSPCAKVCLPVDYQPITPVGDVQIFSLATSTAGSGYSGSVSLLARLQNPNASIAAMSFDYTITFYDESGTSTALATGQSFIYGADIRYIDLPNFRLPQGMTVVRAEISTANPVWIYAIDWPKPNVAVQNFTSLLSLGTLKVQGRLTNNDTVILPSVSAVAIFADSDARPIGVSEMVLDNLAPAETRDFDILHPGIAGVDLSKTQVFVYAKRP